MKGAKRVHNVVDAGEVEATFQRVFGYHPYSLQATEEAANDSIAEFHVTGEVDVDDDEEDIALIKMGKVPLYRTNLLLNLLARGGHIETGWYLVRVA